MSEYSFKLCRASDIEEGLSKGLDRDEERFVAVRKDGELFLYQNRCPHLGLPLEWLEDQFLDADGALIQCASHGALFVIESGACVAGPCQGQSLSPVAYEERNGDIFIA